MQANIKENIKVLQNRLFVKETDQQPGIPLTKGQ